MASKKKTPVEPDNSKLTYLVGKHDKVELHELYMVAVAQQMMGQGIVQAVNAITGASREHYLEKLGEIKKTLGVADESQLIVNFLTGAATVQHALPTPEAPAGE